MSGWMLISRLGSFNVMVPIAAAVALRMGAGGDWRTLRLWCVAIASVIFITAASKIAFFGWGFGIRSLDFTGVSGHAALSAAVLPVALVLALQLPSQPMRLYGYLFGFFVATCVAIARVKLHAHSVAEVVSALLIGSAASALTVQSMPPASLEARRPLIIVGLLVLVAASLMRSAPTQRWMIASALYLSGHDRPFIRHGWRPAPRAWERAPSGADKFHSTGEK